VLAARPSWLQDQNERPLQTRAIAHAGLARAYPLQGEAARPKEAYQNFLTLWKDAGFDVPILKQAKAEYAKLR
jgi:eukaryotic-like serine/threonine-protein kinase